VGGKENNSHPRSSGRIGEHGCDRSAPYVLPSSRFRPLAVWSKHPAALGGAVVAKACHPMRSFGAKLRHPVALTD